MLSRVRRPPPRPPDALTSRGAGNDREFPGRGGAAPLLQSARLRRDARFPHMPLARATASRPGRAPAVIAERLHDPLTVTEHQNFDPIYQMIKSWCVGGLRAEQKSSLVEMQCSAVAALLPIIEEALSNEESALRAQSDPTLRNAVKMYSFLLSWIVGVSEKEHTEAAGCAPVAVAQKGAKGKAKVHAAPDPPVASYASSFSSSRRVLLAVRSRPFPGRRSEDRGVLLSVRSRRKARRSRAREPGTGTWTASRCSPALSCAVHSAAMPLPRACALASCWRGASLPSELVLLCGCF